MSTMPPARPDFVPPRQLGLPFPYHPQYQAADFLQDESNRVARHWLDQPGAWPQQRLAIWGDSGCGKTHLAHLWTGRWGSLIQGSQVRGLVPLPDRGGVAIDDADEGGDERALLHLLNRCAEAGRAVLLTSRQAPARWMVALPDLASRLRAITAIPIAAPGEALLRALLARLLADRQLSVAEPIQDALLQRLPRTPASIREAAARLDRASLGQRGCISLRFARAVLTDLEELGPEDDGAGPQPSPWPAALL